jgi:hypothetical protein
MSESIFYFPQFVAGLIVGICLITVFKGTPHIIIDYPKPEDLRTFKDNNNTCYKYTSTEVACDAHEATLKPYPLQ